MIEVRTDDSYDADTPGNGVAIWSVSTTESFAPRKIEGMFGPDDSEDAAIFHLGAPGSRLRGGNRLWQPSDGWVSLPWLDGTDSGLRVKVLAIDTEEQTADIAWRGENTLVQLAAGERLTVPLPDMGPLCPTMLTDKTADRDFNGPATCRLRTALSVVGSRDIEIECGFAARAQDPGDNTATTETFVETLFRADDMPELTGYVINVESSRVSFGQGVSTAGGAQIGSPGGENDLLKLRPTGGTLVGSYWVVGDTGGDDISTDDDCSDDTRATVKFNFVTIRADAP